MESFESEITPVEAWRRIWGFIRKPKNSSAIAALSTLLMFIVTAYSVREFRRQTVLDQRAWIGLQGVDGFPKVGEKLRVSTHYINTGKTLALHVRRQAKWEETLGEDKFKPHWDPPGIADFNVSRSYAVSDLVPNLVMTQYIHDPRGDLYQVSQREYDWIMRGDVVFRVYGRVCYDDIFQKPHWMRFCDFYNPRDKTYSSCDVYNEIDNDDNGTEETCNE